MQIKLINYITFDRFQFVIHSLPLKYQVLVHGLFRLECQNFNIWEAVVYPTELARRLRFLLPQAIKSTKNTTEILYLISITKSRIASQLAVQFGLYYNKNTYWLTQKKDDNSLSQVILFSFVYCLSTILLVHYRIQFVHTTSINGLNTC